MAKENNYEVKKVNYRKTDGSASERQIIEFGQARDTILALQVDELNDAQRNEIRTLLLNQKAELAAAMAGLGLQFKSFKPGMLTYLEGPQA